MSIKVYLKPNAYPHPTVNLSTPKRHHVAELQAGPNLLFSGNRNMEALYVQAPFENLQVLNQKWQSTHQELKTATMDYFYRGRHWILKTWCFPSPEDKALDARRERLEKEAVDGAKQKVIANLTFQGIKALKERLDKYSDDPAFWFSHNNPDMFCQEDCLILTLGFMVPVKTVQTWHQAVLTRLMRLPEFRTNFTSFLNDIEVFTKRYGQDDDKYIPPFAILPEIESGIKEIGEKYAVDQEPFIPAVEQPLCYNSPEYILPLLQSVVSKAKQLQVELNKR